MPKRANRLFFQVIEELKALGRPDMLVVCGGVIPPQDYQDLISAGVTAIYGPGTNIAVAARQLVTIIEENLSKVEPNEKTQTL